MSKTNPNATYTVNTPLDINYKTKVRTGNSIPDPTTYCYYGVICVRGEVVVPGGQDVEEVRVAIYRNECDIPSGDPPGSIPSYEPPSGEYTFQFDEVDNAECEANEEGSTKNWLAIWAKLAAYSSWQLEKVNFRGVRDEKTECE